VASHVINRAYIPHLKKLGLTYPQYITLTLLWERDGQSVGALAGQLRMNTSTLTPLIKRLEALGHVQRRRGETDERQVFVHLTRDGRSLQAKAPEITACMVEGTRLTREELHRLQDLLKRLSDGLQ
jgi:DNA-binding MarR family transcriptional regulator